MGHHGYERTMELLKSRVYWPGMYGEVKDYIDNCERCTMGRAPVIHTTSGHLLASCPLEILAKVLVCDWFQRYGVLQRIHSDHPRGNAQHDLLSSLPPELKTKWPQYLPELVQAYNNTLHASTGFSPHFLLFGQELQLPVDYLVGRAAPSAVGPTDWVRQHRLRLQDADARALKHLQQAVTEGETDRPEGR